MSTRVLVLGATGMLGHKLVQVLAREAALDVHAASRRAVDAAFRAPGVTWHTGLDLGAGSRPLADLLAATRPSVVVNAIGAIKQRDIHASPDTTFFLNATTPHLIALLNPQPDGRVIQVSTDCVFTGTRGGYTEADAPDATDLYGRSKACGELDYGPHLTLRTSIVGFEIHGQLGLLGWLFSQPRGSRLRGFAHAIFSGLPTATLSRMIADIIRYNVALRGTYHVASEPVSKLELLTRVNEAFGLGLRIEPDTSVRIDRSLDDSRFRQAIGWPRPGWTELVATLERDYASLPYESIYQSVRA